VNVTTHYRLASRTHHVWRSVIINDDGSRAVVHQRIARYTRRVHTYDIRVTLGS